MITHANLHQFPRDLPGSEIVLEGLKDLALGKITVAGLLVLIASPRLRGLGVDIPAVAVPKPYEHQLYALLEKELGRSAYSRYNSLIRRLVSFSRALAK